MATLESLELRISANAQDATKGLDKLIGSLQSLQSQLSGAVEKLARLNTQLERMSKFKSIKALDVDKLTGSSKKIKQQTDAIKEQTQAITDLSKVTGYMKDRGQIMPWVQEKLQSGQGFSPSEYGPNPISTNIDSTKVEEVKNELNETTVSAEQARTACEKFGESFSSIKSGISKATSGLSSFFSRVKRIATTMLIRKAIRGIISAMKEGITNFYNWSKAVNGTFAKSIGTAQGKIQQMKNSLGAALAPVVQLLIPAFNALTSAIITAANWLNQFFSLLSGASSWTRATAAASDLSDSMQGAGGGAQDLLAAFDELNVIQSSGGGGGGGDNIQEQLDLFENLTTFDEKIRSLVNFIKDNMELIKGLIVAAGAALLAWKVSEAFDGLISTVAGVLALAGTAAVTIGLTWLFTNEYLNTGEPGWIIADALTTALGTAAAWHIAQQLWGGNAGAWAAAITLTLDATTGIVAVLGDADVGAFSTESLVALFENALKAGAAAGILLKTVGGKSLLVSAGEGAGVALAVFAVSVGLKAALDPDVEMFSLEQLTTAIGAAVAAGFAMFMFAGAIPAAAVAIATFAVLVGIKLVTQSKNIEVDPVLVTLTETQVKAFVEGKMFTVNPRMVISATEDSISKLDMDSEAIEAKLSSMMGVMEVIKLGLASSDDYQTIKDEITKTGGLIDKVSDWINDAENLNKLVLKITPKLVGEDGEEQGQWYLESQSGWETVKKHMQDLGKELADSIVEGEKGEMIAKRPERVTEILEEISRIANIIAGSDVATEAQIDFNLKLQDLDSSSFDRVMEEYANYKTKMQEAAKELQETAKANQMRLISALTQMLEVDPKNEDLKKKLADAEAALEEISKNWDTAVEAAMEEFTAPGRTMLQEWLNANFDVGSIKSPFDKETIRQWFESDGMSIEEVVERVLQENQINVDINDFFEVGGWNLLSADLQYEILSSLTLDEKTMKGLKDRFKVDVKDFIRVYNFGAVTDGARKDFVSSMMKSFKPADVIAALKEVITNISADGVVKMTDWDKLSGKERLEFITAMNAEFGSEATKQALKNIGIDIGKEVNDGLNSQDSEIQKTAGEWNAIIDTALREPEHTVEAGVTFDKSKVTDQGKKMADLIYNYRKNKNNKPVPDMKAKMTYVKDEATKTASNLAKVASNKKPKMEMHLDYNNAVAKKTANELKDAVEKIAPKMPVTADVTENSVKKVREAFQNQKGITISVSPVANKEGTSAYASGLGKVVAPTVGNAVANDVSAKVKKLHFNVDINGDTVTLRAGGGLVQSGDVFIANENGRSEMIGRFGNQTAVANQEQMVEAMARGVENGQATQNSLLREQNALLRAILQKESTVKLSASSALGRTVKQSMAMYGTLTGG